MYFCCLTDSDYDYDSNSASLPLYLSASLPLCLSASLPLRELPAWMDVEEVYDAQELYYASAVNDISMGR